ncbi:MAG: radical SAM protein [Myxococcota bacterium]
MPPSPKSPQKAITIALVNPPSDLVEEAGRFARVYNLIPPLGIAYIAANLKKSGFNTICLDAGGGRLSLKGLTEELKRHSPQIVGVTATTFAIPSAKALIERVRGVLPGTITVIGGAHISAVPERGMEESGAHLGIIGEGEKAMVEIAEALLEGKKDFKGIDGLIIRDSTGQLFKTRTRPLFRDLDSLPPPAWELMPPLKSYSATPASYRRLPVAHLFTSRGCPYRCTFCSNSVFGRSLRKHSVERVIEEVVTLVKRFGAREVRFFDDVFTIDRERVIEIGEGILRRVGRIPWTCLTRPDLVERDFLKEIKRLGCWQILFGFESPHQKRLDDMKKGFKIEEVEEAVIWAKEAGLKVRGDFIIGLPGETVENMRACLKFAINSGLDMAHFNIWIPYPGAPLTRQLEEKGLIRHYDYLKYGGEGKSPKDGEVNLPHVPEGFSEAEFVAEVEKLFFSFYRRPGYILRQALSIRTLDDIRRFWLGFKTFFLS